MRVVLRGELITLAEILIVPTKRGVYKKIIK